MRRILFVSFYTDFYKKAADELTLMLKRFELDYVMERIEDRGAWRLNVCTKPRFILDQMEKHQEYGAVVWIDADTQVLAKPELFWELEEPLAMRFVTPRVLNKEEPIAGIMYFRNTPEIRSLVSQWADMVERADPELRRPEQKMMRELLLKQQIAAHRLGVTYGHLPQEKQPPGTVISHRRWSAIVGPIPMSKAETEAKAARAKTRDITRKYAVQAIKRLRPLKLKWKKKHGYGVFSVPSKKKAMLSYTFDDGRLVHFTEAAKALEEFGFRGTFYVVPGAMQPHACMWPRPGGSQIELAGWDTLQKAVDRGHEIGNHSWSHPKFGRKGYKIKPRQEIQKSARAIGQILGHPVFSWAWPYHLEDGNLIDEVESYHSGVRPLSKKLTLSYNRSAQPGGITLKEANSFVDRVIKHRTWGLPVIHDIGFGYKPLDMNVFRDHLKYVAARTKVLAVETVTKVFLRGMKLKMATICDPPDKTS